MWRIVESPSHESAPNCDDSEYWTCRSRSNRATRIATRETAGRLNRRVGDGQTSGSGEPEAFPLPERFHALPRAFAVHHGMQIAGLKLERRLERQVPTDERG